MKIKYWDCKYEAYDELWDGENETRIYGCSHPDGCGTCDKDNAYGGKKDECAIAEMEQTK